MFDGKVVLVTGGGRGIGRAIAIEFAKNGGTLYITSRTEQQLKQTAKLIKDAGGICHIVACDLTDEAAIAATVAKIEQEHGKLDVLVNNAGTLAKGMMEDMDMKEFNETLAVNVVAPYMLCRLVLPLMKKTGGAIVNIASLAGIRSVDKFRGIGAYTVSKHAVVGLTEALAVEWMDYGIRVNCIAPGAVETEMLRKAAPDLEPVIDPSAVAKTVCYLASGAASGINGSTLEMFSNLLAKKG